MPSSEKEIRMTSSDDKRSAGGIAPFGYKWLNGSLVIDSDEAPVRKLIYELFLKHKRKKTVAKLLNDLGYRTRGGALFSDTTIGRLLKDTTAKGVRTINESEIGVDPIIEVDVWERANNILQSSQRSRTPVYLFTGIAYCACGGRITVPGGSLKYVCEKCRHKIPIDDLNEIFASQLSIVEIDSPDPNSTKQEHLSDYWHILSNKEKRIIIESLCEKVVVGKHDIYIELALSTSSPKTNKVWQQNESGNKTLEKASKTEPSPSDISEPLLSEAEAAKFLGISKMTLLRKRNAGTISFFRVGFRVLYSKEKHLIPFLQQCEK